MRTLADLRTLVIANVGNRSDKNTVINAAINFGLEHALGWYTFHEVRAESDLVTEIDDLYVDLPTGAKVSEARLVVGLSLNPITLKSKIWVVSRWPNIVALSSGRPQYGYIQGGKLYFSCPLGDAYPVRVTYAIPPVLSADETENPITILDEALIAYGTAAVFRSVQNFDAANLWTQQYGTLLAAARALDLQHNIEHKADVVESEPSTFLNPWEDPFYGFDVGA